MYTKIFLTQSNAKMFWYKQPYLLGQSEKWEIISDDGGLITIGNQTVEDPIKLNFKNKGTYRLTANLIPYFSDKLSDQIFTIECGGRKNIFYTIGNHMGTLNVSPPYTSENFGFNFSCLLEANEGETSTISVIGHNCWNMSSKTGLYGHPEEIWSSISLESISGENNEPMLITQDAPLQINRRHIIKAPIGKFINLHFEKPEKIKVGDWIELKNMDVGNFQINNGEKVEVLMNGLMTRLKTGYIRSRKKGDFLRLECMEISPKIVFSDIQNIGTFTII